MVEAYIFLSTETGRWRDSFERIKELKQVKEASRVTGDFDTVVLAEAEDMPTLTNTVVEEVHEIEGVTDTITAIVVD